jgi:hypothetical protein
MPTLWCWPAKHCPTRIQACVKMPLNFRERNQAKSLFSSLCVATAMPCITHRTKELRFTPLWLIPRHKKRFSHHYVRLVRLCAESGRKTLQVICSQVYNLAMHTSTYTNQMPSSLSLRATTQDIFCCFIHVGLIKLNSIIFLLLNSEFKTEIFLHYLATGDKW